jgi:hypothetical protein
MAWRVVWVACVVLVCAGFKVSAQEDLSLTRTAKLEGVQLSSEPGTEAGELVNSCYFIFRDNPSAFFYDLKKKEKKLVFEFTDVVLGEAPIESATLEPIKSFTVEARRVNANVDIIGLEPEWHDIVTVTFDLSRLPRISVTEEYSVTSFSFKWSSDPSRICKYAADCRDPGKIALIAGGAGALVAGGIVAAVLLIEPEEPTPAPQPLDPTDLPAHPTDPLSP